jgi:hypothetical protein
LHSAFSPLPLEIASPSHVALHPIRLHPAPSGTGASRSSSSVSLGAAGAGGGVGAIAVVVLDEATASVGGLVATPYVSTPFSETMVGAAVSVEGAEGAAAWTEAAVLCLPFAHG